MLDLGFQQLDIANELESPTLRSEAYLTLAQGNERMGNSEKAVTYCRHSLYNQCDQSKTTGNVHLTLGKNSCQSFYPCPCNYLLGCDIAYFLSQCVEFSYANKIRIKHQLHPKSNKLDAFEKKSEYVTTSYHSP